MACWSSRTSGSYVSSLAAPAAPLHFVHVVINSLTANYMQLYGNQGAWCDELLALRMLTGRVGQVLRPGLRNRLLHVSAWRTRPPSSPASCGARPARSSRDGRRGLGDGSERPNTGIQTKRSRTPDLTRVRGVTGVAWAVRLFKGKPGGEDAPGKVRRLGASGARRRDAVGRSAEDASRVLGSGCANPTP